MINFGRIGAVSGDSGEVFRQATVREKLVQEGLPQQSAGSMASESPDEAERPRTRAEASRPCRIRPTIYRQPRLCKTP